ncbi:endonuclease III domain-containing protein [Candidatus Woesearchaeota archaeon]|nr:endonuclease III domain-containing protein [Candidatus Woesearchaeota archaeon]
MLKIYNKLLNEYGKQNWWPTQTSERQFEIILGTILTQNTSWNNVEKAITNLKNNNLISKEKIKKVPLKRLASLIKPSGYFNQKTKRLKVIAKFLEENPNPCREELLKVNGIGPETADSILLYSFNKPYFVIDAYTKRIMQRIGYKEDDYGELQKLFQKNLPKNYKIYNEFHALLVEHAKKYCRKKPLCEKCPLKSQCHYFKSSA